MERKPLDYYRALYRIVTEVASSTTVEQRVQSIVRSTAQTMGVKGCSLMLLTPDGTQLIHTASHGLSSFYIKKGPVNIDPIIDEALKGHPVTVDDVTTDPRIQYRDQAIMEGIASMLSIPVMLEGEILGVLRIYTAEPRRFSSSDIEFLNLVATFGAVSLSKARLYETKEKYYKDRIRDMADRWAELKHDLVELETAKAKLLTFLSMAAHDLKAPLSALQTYFDVLLDGFVGEMNEKQLEIITRSSARVDGLFELISDLLDICRIESTQIVSEMTDVPLAEVVEEPLEDARRLALEKGVELVVEVGERLPLICGCAPRLQQVITNLLSNAIKFTPAGGKVCFTLVQDDGQIVGEVQDTGIGIPEPDLPFVFDDFFRARNAKEPGTGLGLPIVKKIVEAHGGCIAVESPSRDTGEGSKFIFSLPVLA